MKPAFLIIFSLIALVCSAAQREEQTAPSGAFMVRADVPVAEVSPSFRLRVRLVFVNLESKKELHTFTGASGQWAIAWTADNVLVLLATKNEDGIPVHAFELRRGEIVERSATDAERKIARQAYERKYKNKQQKPAMGPRNVDCGKD